MDDEVSRKRLLLVIFLIISFSIFNGAGIGYFTLFFDVWEGAILFGVFLGIIPAVLFWKYVSRRAEIV